MHGLKLVPELLALLQSHAPSSIAETSRLSLMNQSLQTWVSPSSSGHACLSVTQTGGPLSINRFISALQSDFWMRSM